MKSHLVSTLLLAFLITTSAHADPVTTFDDIDTWIGFGSQEAALVLDWNDGKDPLLYGYRFDGPKSGEEMLLEVIATQDELFARVGPSGTFGTPLYGIGVDRDGDGFGIRDKVTDESGIFTGFSIAETEVPDEFDDGAAIATDPDDSYREGWFTGFWSFWNSTGLPANGGWGPPSTGANERTLADGDWDGFSFDPTFSFNDPPAVVIAVPEAGSVCVLLGVGCIAINRRRRS